MSGHPALKSEIPEPAMKLVDIEEGQPTVKVQPEQETNLEKVKEAFAKPNIQDQDGKFKVDNNLAELAVKTVPYIIEDNYKLKEDLRECQRKLDEKDKEIIGLTETCFKRNTDNIVLTAEMEKMKKSSEENAEILKEIKIVKRKQDKVLSKIEDSETKVTKPLLEEVKNGTESIKTNVDRLYEILENRSKNVVCRIKMLQELEKGSCSLTFFGSKDAVQKLNQLGQLRRDMDNLKKKGKINIKQTDTTGSENLITLLETKEPVDGNSAAVIILNFTAETASFLLDDEQNATLIARQIGLYGKKMIKAIENKYKHIIFILPPITVKSHTLNKEVAESVKSIAENAIVINLAEIQQQMGDQCENDEEVFKVEENPFLKRFVGEEDSEEDREGYNDFATKVLVTKVVERVLEKGQTWNCCSVCGFGHSLPTESCQNEEISKFEEEPMNKKQRFEKKSDELEPELCLKCLKGHDIKDCWVRENTSCRYAGCNMQGHLQAIHYPKKKETIPRLKREYGERFQVNTSQSTSSIGKRDHGAEKRTRNNK